MSGLARDRASRRHQLPEQVASHVRELIISGMVRPGEFLRVERIAEEVGVSNTPVRELIISGLVRPGEFLRVERFPELAGLARITSMSSEPVSTVDLVEYARPVSFSQKFGDVTVDVHGDHVAVTEIGRPPDNFFDAGLIGSLADAYEWSEAHAGARAVLLCSAGKHFCAGADFTGRSLDSGASPASAGNYAGDLYAQAARLFRARLPVVAAVQGAAVGGGLGLACSADFRVASPAARFSANFARLGLHQGFGLSVTLPAIVGQQHANLMLYTGRRVKGEEAVRLGLADLLADPDGLRAAAHGLAAEIAASAPLAVRSIRSTQRAGLAERVTAAMAAELAEQDQLRQTADFAEGVRASAERRPPRFEGR